MLEGKRGRGREGILSLKRALYPFQSRSLLGLSILTGEKKAFGLA